MKSVIKGAAQSYLNRNYWPRFRDNYGIAVYMRLSCLNYFFAVSTVDFFSPRTTQWENGMLRVLEWISRNQCQTQFNYSHFNLISNIYFNEKFITIFSFLSFRCFVAVSYVSISFPTWISIRNVLFAFMCLGFKMVKIVFQNYVFLVC